MTMLLALPDLKPVNQSNTGLTPNDIFKKLSETPTIMRSAMRRCKGKKNLQKAVNHISVLPWIRLEIAQAIRLPYSVVWGSGDLFHPVSDQLFAIGRAHFGNNIFLPPAFDDSTPLNSIFNAVKDAIWAKGFQQKDIAKKLGIKYDSVWRVVKGIGYNPAVRFAISEALEIPYWEVWGLKDLEPCIYEILYIKLIAKNGDAA